MDFDCSTDFVPVDMPKLRFALIFFHSRIVTDDQKLYRRIAES